MHLLNLITKTKGTAILKKRSDCQQFLLPSRKCLFKNNVCFYKRNCEFCSVAEKLGSERSERRTPLYDSAKSLLELLQSDTVKNPMGKNFLREFDSHDDANLSWVNERYIFLNDSFLKINSDVWEKLKNAMKSSRTVTFKYRKQNANNSEKRTVAPYQIVNSNNNWYLWGFDYRRNENRTFLLNRITSLSLTAKKFTLPSDFDFRNHSTGFYGAYSSNNFKKFKVKFSKEVADYIKTQSFGREQKIKTKKDGSLEVSFEASEFELILRTIISFGTDAVPLEPKEFVDEWKKKISAMYELARKN